MPLAIIAGMPSGKANELQAHLPFPETNEDWSLAWIPARSNSADLGSCWKDVQAQADSTTASGTHILAFHKVISERAQYEEEVRFRHRIVWLTHSLLYPPAGDEWWTEIEERLHLEAAWRRDVRPQSQHDALILPSGVFASTRDPWTRAQRAQTEAEFAQARAEIRIFSERHRHQGLWRDDNSLVFDSSGAQHGQAPPNRRWKLTYRLPAAFHFDVRHEARRTFSIADGLGGHRTFREYTNVDAHGHVRGGR